MGSQLFRALLLLGLAVSKVKNSCSESSEDETVSNLTRNSSSDIIDYRASPVELKRKGSIEPRLIEDQRRHYYDPQLFLPLGMDNIFTSSASGNTPTSLTVLENALKPDVEAIEVPIVDFNFITKSIASICIALILLVFYNVIFLHLIH